MPGRDYRFPRESVAFGAAIPRIRAKRQFFLHSYGIELDSGCTLWYAIARPPDFRTHAGPPWRCRVTMEK